MTENLSAGEGGAGDPAPDPSIQSLIDGLGEVLAASAAPDLDFDDEAYVPPAPLARIEADSDLKATESLYEPEQLADVSFVYCEMLFLRGAVEVMRDELQRYRIADLRRTDPETADWLYGSTVDAGFELTPAGAAYVSEAGR